VDFFLDSSFDLSFVASVYACRDADLVQKIAAATSLELRASGTHYISAPSVSVRHLNQLLNLLLNSLYFKFLSIAIR
jgi:hypothetical protein